MSVAAKNTRLRVFERDGHQCVKCGSTEDLTIDHIYPRVHGGCNCFVNLQTLCRLCNEKKGTKRGPHCCKRHLVHVIKQERVAARKEPRLTYRIIIPGGLELHRKEVMQVKGFASPQ